MGAFKDGVLQHPSVEIGIESFWGRVLSLRCAKEGYDGVRRIDTITLRGEDAEPLEQREQRSFAQQSTETRDWATNQLLDEASLFRFRNEPLQHVPLQ